MWKGDFSFLIIFFFVLLGNAEAKFTEPDLGLVSPLHSFSLVFMYVYVFAIHPGYDTPAASLSFLRPKEVLCLSPTKLHTINSA